MGRVEPGLFIHQSCYQSIVLIGLDIIPKNKFLDILLHLSTVINIP